MIIVEPPFIPDVALYARQERVTALDDEYTRLTMSMTPARYTETERLYNKAIGYSWGRQDAGDHTARFDDYEFGLAYGVHAARFTSEHTHSLTTVRQAYEQYRDRGVIA